MGVWDVGIKFSEEKNRNRKLWQIWDVVAVEDQGLELEFQNEKLDAVNGKISDSLNEEVNGNVERSNGEPPVVNGGTWKDESAPEDGKGIQVSVADSAEEHNGKTESSAEAEDKQVVGLDRKIEGAIDGEEEKSELITKSESPPGFVENHESRIGDLGLAARSGEDEGSNNTSSQINSSGDANDENGNQINLSVTETSEACQGSQDLVVDVVECGLQDVSVEAEDEVKKLAKEVVQNAENEVSPSTCLDLDLESNPIDTKEETDVVPDVVECDSQDVSVNAEDEVKLSGEVVETAEHEVPPSTSLDLDMESNFINTKEETNLGVDAIQCELEDVSVKAKDVVKLSVEVVETAEDEVPPSTSLDLDLGSSPFNTKEETDVGVDVECEFQDVNVKGKDEVNLAGKMVESTEHEDPPSTSLDLDLELNPINSKEETDVGVDVVECEFQDVSVKVKDMVKLSEEVAESAELEVPQSTSLDLDLDSNIINTKEEKDLAVNVVGIESEDLSVEAEAEAEAEVNLSGEVAETAEHELPPSTSLDLESESNPSNTKEETNVVVDVVECELQDVSLEAKDEVKLLGEVVETAEPEVPLSTSLDLGLEFNPINSKEETLKEEAETTLSLDVLEDQQCDYALGNNVQVVLEQRGEAKPVLSTTDYHVETVCDLVLEEKDMEDIFASHIDNGVKYPEEPDKHPDGSGVSQETIESETKTEASEPTQSFPASVALAPQIEIEVYDVETVGAVSSSPVGGQNSQITEKGLPGQDGWIRCTTNEATSVSDSTLDMVVLTEKEPAFQGGEARAEPKVSSGKDNVPNSPPATSGVKMEPELVHNFSAISSGEMTGDVAGACRTDVSDSCNVNKEDAAKIELEIEHVEDTVDQMDGAAGSRNNLLLQENEDTGNSQSNNILVASPGDSSGNMIDREASIKTKTKPFNFLIRVPRFDDECLREQIRLAKLNVDEKTKLRDAIQIQIQEKRANSQIHGIDYEYAKGEGRNARKLVRSKRMEIDSLQSVINKAKNALSIEDIDSQIYNMEHMIQHETLPLKEEKQLIREIKQLKQLREQLSSNMGSQDEIKQALEQREEVEERLKILRKELDILKDRVLKAEATAMEAEKKYDDENKKVKELQAQFRAADDVRQAAYAQWQSLRKELSKKVENFMELWNTNDEFRREYVKFNARSTVRRLGTLDGRSLGPDEEPPILPSYVDERVNRIVSTPVKVDLASQFPTLEFKQERTKESVTSDGKSMKKMIEDKNQKVTNKESAISVQMNGLDTVSGEDITYEVHEEPKKSREEIEAIKKAEEMKREETEAKLKEQRRLEALAKANEARERKKRQAEKLQMRAELKTLKEAEQKEREREKRLRKKERKKAAATDVNDINNCEIAPSSESTVETSKDIEVKDVSSVTPKKSNKHWLFTKQSKTKSIPPPLRNRNKKKLQQYMWVGITSAAIFVLFWLGNIGVFSNDLWISGIFITENFSSITEKY
ncbi:hypothetical protein DH2020_004267 [Rehmannia glutinosa]|uniref:Uncharacterized protein n=1 Tax=Rehmannia glutinosa TaxID=99300 RepID=A0ABR0XP04_REHGL